MASCLLVVIYLAFISLGLPDPMLGAAWPTMGADLGARLSAAGAVSMIISAGTIVSSLASNWLIHRLGVGRVMLASVGATALALLGFAQAGSLAEVCLLAVPLGLGAGAVDAALNNYVALNYKALHMNWLHGMWGVGATAGPMIMAAHLAHQGDWPGGYRAVAHLQLGLVVVLALSLPLWRAVHNSNRPAGAPAGEYVSTAQALRTPGVKLALATFFCFVGFEASAGLWASSYLVQQRGLDAVAAASWASLFFGGTMVGRFFSGLLALRCDGRTMIRGGLVCALVAAILLVLPLPPVAALVGLVLLGLGNAPLYPAMIHETPRRFGESVSQAATGLQMACAYVGMTFLPPIEGLLAQVFSLALIPWAVLLLVLGGAICSEALNRRIDSIQRG